MLAGGAVRVWAAGYLFKTHELAMWGPYAYVRHPLYLGRLLLLCGFTLMARLGQFGYRPLQPARASMAVRLFQ